MGPAIGVLASPLAFPESLFQVGTVLPEVIVFSPLEASFGARLVVFCARAVRGPVPAHLAAWTRGRRRLTAGRGSRCQRCRSSRLVRRSWWHSPVDQVYQLANP